MEENQTKTIALLDEWHQGNEKALDALLDLHLPTIRSMVKKRRSEYLRGKEETSDFIQEAVLRFLRFGPKVRIANEKSFCAFLSTVVQNMLNDRYSFYQANCRGGLTPVTLHTQDGGDLDTPSRILGREEARNLIRAGLEFLEPEDREIIFLRRWENQTFDTIGNGLSISKAAATQRFCRAMARLTQLTRRLEDGKLDTILAEVSRDRDERS